MIIAVDGSVVCTRAAIRGERLIKSASQGAHLSISLKDRSEASAETGAEWNKHLFSALFSDFSGLKTH